ncbi:MAG: anti-sigma factor family protein [Candidatus Zixiibacteriota bacterium]
MRCRKVRSYLSAYSNNELTGRRLLVVREHLSTCAECRKEEAIYTSMRRAGKILSDVPVSSDFNARLLDRIAQERFSETRSRAYLPRTAPAVQWWKVVPAVTAALLLVFFGVNTLLPMLDRNPQQLAVTDESLDNSYLTVQPTNNPNLEVDLNKLLAKVERSDRIYQEMARQDGFGALQPLDTWVNVNASSRAPFVNSYYRIKPVIRIYNLNAATPTGGYEKVY